MGVSIHDSVIEELAPKGVLRVALNMANFLLVTGRDGSGNPTGVSPGVAHAVANELGVPVEFIEYKGPGEIADSATTDAWDIGNIAAEAERAKVIHFSDAYCEIQATYMLPPGSTIKTLDQVDQAGHRIAVKERAAYDLYLSATIKHATLVRVESIDDSFKIFEQEQLEVLAGLRPALLTQQIQMPGARILDQSFTAVQQSIGCKPGKPAAAEYLKTFVRRSITNGLIDSLIEKHGVKGRLSSASPVA